ncbi:MAG TPA: hypothetical protein VGN16_22135 [Acidobacteriaceae bacterium]|jgi:hypothetical protein
MDYEIDDDGQPEEHGAGNRLSISKPLIGLAICVCLFLLSILIAGLLRGGDAGSHPGGDTATFDTVLLIGSVAGAVVCVLWIILVLVLNALRD